MQVLEVGSKVSAALVRPEMRSLDSACSPVNRSPILYDNWVWLAESEQKALYKSRLECRIRMIKGLNQQNTKCSVTLHPVTGQLHGENCKDLRISQLSLESERDHF